MTSEPPHLLIKEGPERGRELTIPPEGARLGRATENDLNIADAAMSRFQCRVYFRDGLLHIMDLGSTNETLVNDKPVSDQALRYGDEILAGETLIKVINDGLSDSGKTSESGEPAPAPIIFNPEGDDPEEPEDNESSDKSTEASPAPLPSALEDNVDLGLGRRDDEDTDESERGRRSALPYLFFILITMIAVLAIGLFVLLLTAPEGFENDEPPPDDDSLEIIYEKVQAGDGNIFRYYIELDAEGSLSGEVHDLQNQRNTERDIQVEEERLNQFVQQILNEKESFVQLQEEYEGIPAGTHEAYSITLIFGREVKQVDVANQLEPDAFKRVREQIEAFSNTELNIINSNIPPEELRQMASESWENANKLYAERDVKNENLWQATQKLKDVIFLLDSIEPKPTYYREAVELRRQWRKDLLEKVEALDFEAVRAYQVGELNRAANFYRRMMATLPDKTSRQYKHAQNTLVRIEQELNR